MAKVDGGLDGFNGGFLRIVDESISYKSLFLAKTVPEISKKTLKKLAFLVDKSQG